MSELPQIRLALCDDHHMVLESLGSWIAQNAPEFDVTVSVSTWTDLVLNPRFPTDLVFLDVQLRETISIEARVRTCRAAGAAVIVLSSLDDDDARARALGAGAAAFVSKGHSMDELMDLARAVMRRSTARKSAVAAHIEPVPLVAAPTPVRLSSGEKQALRLYASGLHLSSVAEEMGVKYETAKTYLRRAREKYAKVGRPASRKADLIRRAAEDGLLE